MQCVEDGLAVIASWRGTRRSQPCGSKGASRSEYLLEAVPLRFIRLLPGHKSGLQMFKPRRARRVCRKLESHLMSCKKITYICLKCNFFSIAWNGKRNFMAPIHPKWK